MPQALPMDPATAMAAGTAMASDPSAAASMADPAAAASAMSALPAADAASKIGQTSTPDFTKMVDSPNGEAMLTKHMSKPQAKKWKADYKKADKKGRQAMQKKLAHKKS